MLPGKLINGYAAIKPISTISNQKKMFSSNPDIPANNFASKGVFLGVDKYIMCPHTIEPGEIVFYPPYHGTYIEELDIIFVKYEDLFMIKEKNEN